MSLRFRFACNSCDTSCVVAPSNLFIPWLAMIGPSSFVIQIMKRLCWWWLSGLRLVAFEESQREILGRETLDRKAIPLGSRPAHLRPYSSSINKPRR